MAAGLWVSLLGVLLVQGQSSSPAPSPCVEALTSATDVAVGQFCTAEDLLKSADALPKDSQERSRRLEQAALAYRRAVSLSTNPDTRSRALNRLADTYDLPRLNQPAALEPVLRELIALTPDDLIPVYRLADFQEHRELIEAAERTLLDARHSRPDEEEPNRRLAQFYARRVTELRKRNLTTPPETVSNPGERDASGVYRVGQSLAPPQRVDAPHYPADAMAAGITGTVMAEVVIDPSGHVTDARIVRSIPLLDEAALASVRQWRFDPTVVNGEPVPVRMTVTVNFTPPPQSGSGPARQR
jgi:TonB family protein